MKQQRGRFRIIICLTAFLTGIFLLLSAQEPEWEWAVRAGGTSDNYGYAITVDNQGHNYITGSFEGTLTFNNEIELVNEQFGTPKLFVAKLDEKGEFLWARMPGGTSSGTGYGITADNDGNCYLIGYILGGTALFGETTLQAPSNQNRAFVAKIDSEGSWIWAIQAEGDDRNWGHTITIDNSGNIYASLTFQGTVSLGDEIELVSSGFRDICIVKVNNEGEWQWATSAGGEAGSYIHCTDIAIDNEDSVFITGNFNNSANFGEIRVVSAGAYDVYAAKISNTGEWEWVQHCSGTGNNQGNGIAADVSGSLYISGTFSATISFGDEHQLTSAGGDDMFIAKLNSNREWEWARSAQGNGLVRSRGVTVDDSGNIFATGMFSEDVLLGEIEFISSGDWNTVTAKINSTGIWEWGVHIEGTGQVQSTGISADNEGNCYLIGNFERTADFGEIELHAIRNTDIFIAKLSSETTNIDDEYELPLNKMHTSLNRNYPNPFNPGTFISFSLERESIVSLSIYNSKGQLVKNLLNGTEFDMGDNHSMYWDGKNYQGKDVSAGVYLYVLETCSNFRESRKMILIK